MYRLTFHVDGPYTKYDKYSFFKNKEDAERTKNNTILAPTSFISSIDIDEVTFDQIKDQITISQFESLFGLTISAPQPEIKKSNKDICTNTWKLCSYCQPGPCNCRIAMD